jgi:DNA-binding protein H-NS
LIYLIDQMLELHRKHATARTSQEKTAIQRQIKATDEQIDRLVYELYGLTEEEIGIVETLVTAEHYHKRLSIYTVDLSETT